MTWHGLPSRTDPRIPFALLLLAYVTLGITVLGFNRTPAQVLTTVAAACLLDMAFHALFRRELLFPLSAVISGLGLSILMNYAHGWWFPLVPVYFAIASKYVVTSGGRHIFNPTLFAVVMALTFGGGMFSPAPAYQWGGSIAMAAFLVTCAMTLFIVRIGRVPLVVSFLGFYALQLALRAWLTRHHVPPETLFLGAATSAAFYLFTFFMITDPKTSPSSPRAQVALAASIVVIDLVLHRFYTLSTLFYAAFVCALTRWVYLHFRDATPLLERVMFGVRRLVPTALVGVAGLWAHAEFIAPGLAGAAGFRLTAVEAGFSAGRGDLLGRVDPRMANVAKWVLSIGDSAAVADADLDGRPDLFLTLPLKATQSRAALYLNSGSNRFTRFPLPLLTQTFSDPETGGLPAGALWFDYDNDGDADLLVLVGYGETFLLQNRIKEEGALRFEDVTTQSGLRRYGISVAANAFDMDRDGWSDLLICDAFSPWLPGYETPTRFNAFKLPAPAFPGDRRMFNIMHRTWHDANNGGGCAFFHNDHGQFKPKDVGLTDQRWSLAVGTGDLNRDGFTDLYIANDFGPDQLYFNQGGKAFISARGRVSGSIGRDTYKGMNASIADFDGNGWEDVYVSNVHERLQAEGSLLWMNREGRFEDEASARNALNEERFGWGAAVGDLDMDGRLDIVQANGMVDNSYDPLYEGCPDYWYWNDKIALTNPDNHGFTDRWADLRGRCIYPNELPRVYLNRGRYFVDYAGEVGLTRGGVTRGVAVADFSSRGVLDVVITDQFAPAAMYENSGSSASWLGLDLSGDGVRCNADALGTRVTVGAQVREVRAANGFSAQSERRLLFAMGKQKDAAAVRISWCGEGEETRFLDLNRYHRLTQGEPASPQGSPERRP